MRNHSYYRSLSSRLLREARPSPRKLAPAPWTLLLPLLLLGWGGGEARSAPGAEDEGPAKEHVESVSLPIDRESGAPREGTPSPPSDARPRGLAEALYAHVGIDLPALDAATIRTMRLQHGPDWLGPHRTLPESAAAELPGTWGLTSAGEPIWRVTVRSAQAAAVAIRFETFDVDGEVWVYTPDGAAYAGPYSGRGPRGNGAFWSDPLPADTVTVEYFPRQRGIGETTPPFRIPEISHHARLEPRKAVASPLVPRRSRTPGDAERSSLSPYKDATCSMEFLRRGGHDQERLVDAVAMMLSRRETGSYQCTAFVLRNLRESDRTTLPSYYDAVFTSGNCIRNQREAVDATFYWKYRTSTCDGTAPSLGSLEVTRGARLWDRKWTESTFGKVEDYALLLVPRDELPGDVYRAGWTTADVVRGEDVYTLGHPWGEPLRLAVGDVDDPDEGSWLTYSPSFGVGADYGRSGGTGTSGSPVFGRLAEDGRLLGILRGTSSSWFQSREWVVHKFRSVRGDFRHLSHVEPSTQRVSYRMGSDTHWFTFYESNFLQGWVLNNKRVVESGDTVAQGGANFVVERRNDRWRVRLVDVHGNTQEAATGISLGSSAEGTINPPRDVDWFRFETTEPTTVEVYTTGDADTVGALHGGLEREDDNGGAGANFRIQEAVPAGVHYVMVSGSDPEGLAQGEYTLHVRYADVHGNARSAATAVALGSSTGGSIGTAGDVDWFRFETTGPRTVEVYTTGGIDTVGAVNGVEDDNGGDNSNFSIRTTVSGGTHYVRVSGAGSTTGSYSLHTRSLFSDNALGMEFVCVGAGDFVMGSPEGEAGRQTDEVQRAVRISQAFWMGKHEVTQGQWEAVMGSNPSYFKGCGARCPVESVSWEDAEEFIRMLNERETGTGNRYRLPTEAEWEYAARAGTTAATPEGDLRILGQLNAPVLDGQAWYGGNSGASYPGAWFCDWEERQYESERCGTHPVGQKRANGWGLHDMLGNVAEWTADWYGWYPSESVTDPTGSGTGSYRVFRGGGFNFYARHVRVASRRYETPDARHSYRGLRVVRSDALECAQPYSLTLGQGRWTDDHGDSQGFATVMRFGSSTSGSIHAGDEDWFRVETRSSAPATVDVYTTGDTDTIGWLYANGTHAIGAIAEDDNGGEGRNFLIRTEVSPETPNINVRVRGSAPNADGRYTLHVRPAAGAAIRGPLGMEFAWVPPGSFVMGSPAGEAGREDNERQHEVRISRGFWMGRYEVTRGQWEAAMGSTFSANRQCGPDCPVNNVTWEEVQEFIGKLNEREAASGYRYRLPTEAEWEYAARAGTAGARYGPLGGIAWYDANSQQKLHRVGLKRANEWGLHDMLGNVLEWVGDWYGEYESGSVTDPAGPSTGTHRVIRGGSWAFPSQGARAASRSAWRPDATTFLFGFRLVRTE